MGQTKAAVIESKSRDELNEMDMPVDMKAGEAINNDLDDTEDDAVFVQEDLPGMS